MTNSLEHRIGRALLAILFIAGAVQKLATPDVAAALLTDRGLPASLVWPAMLFNACAAVALLTGYFLRATGLLLAAYCLVTSLFHLIPDDPWQMSILIKNWAIAGGCLILAAAARTDRGA